jgi:outer membrane protein TolC
MNPLPHPFEYRKMNVHHFGYAFPLFRMSGMKNEYMMTATPLSRVLGVTVLWVLLLLMAVRAGAQADGLSRVLSQDAFLDIVRNYHPVARQANLIVDRARADLITAQAGFDPLLQLTSERKTFDGKNYFDHFNPGLKIPTWYGVEVAAGLEEHLGDFLNPEVTSGRSSYLSFSVPLAKNLLIDKRRAVLQQARIFREQSKSERLVVLNDLLHEATKDYWHWVGTYLVQEILSEAVEVNEVRMRLVRQGVTGGDRAAIDTTEALAQLQSFRLARDEAWLEYRKAGFELSNYLWRADDRPYEMPMDILPDTAWVGADLQRVELPTMEGLLSAALQEHPKLMVLNQKMKSLDIDRRLKFQDMLPMVNLKYNFLNRGYNVFNEGSLAYYRNNYKFGIDIAMPLRLSQGRGQYQAAKIKINETSLDLGLTRLSIENKVRYQFTELVGLRNQVVLAADNLRNYERLLRGEESRFQLGESTIFLVNIRESKLLEARQKLASLHTKFMASILSLRWSAGQLR